AGEARGEARLGRRRTHALVRVLRDGGDLRLHPVARRPVARSGPARRVLHARAGSHGDDGTQCEQSTKAKLLHGAPPLRSFPARAVSPDRDGPIFTRPRMKTPTRRRCQSFSAQNTTEVVMKVVQDNPRIKYVDILRHRRKTSIISE